MNEYDIDYSRIPKHMRYGMELYVEKGIPPGGFLTAVLSNNLTEAFVRADSINRIHLFDWVKFIMSELPWACWGSVKKVEDWIKSKREREES